MFPGKETRNGTKRGQHDGLKVEIDRQRIFCAGISGTKGTNLDTNGTHGTNGANGTTLDPNRTHPRMS